MAPALSNFSRPSQRPLLQPAPTDVDPPPLPSAFPTDEDSTPALIVPSPTGTDLDAWGDSIVPSAVPLLPEMGSVDQQLATRLAQTRLSLPEVGETFDGFQLLAELGRGAFGRVFLARQGELADRLVALKISTESLDESQKLAQLQ